MMDGITMPRSPVKFTVAKKAHAEVLSEEEQQKRLRLFIKCYCLSTKGNTNMENRVNLTQVIVALAFLTSLTLVFCALGAAACWLAYSLRVAVGG